MRKLFTYLFIPVIGLALLGVSIQNGHSRDQVNTHLDLNIPNPVSQAFEPTQTPTVASETTTPADRVLPPIGGNAGLVLGASVLVLIIIAGVGFTSRRRAKH